ncbi:hypothetical protein [Rodentibacter caecimuris]|uniref:hypothetical protein n=1 Tax=Rodentibacter caecimuris TaxID=1796644 RepID=UPI0025855D86|nr:hypothetical protein [Rodentibacter heylii]
MEELIKIVEAEYEDYQREYYLNTIHSLTEQERNNLLALINKMRKAGSKKPFSWAISEIKENLPQFARFAVLRELEKINREVSKHIYYTQEYAEESDEFMALHKKVKQYLSPEELGRYLQLYTQTVTEQFISLLDEGNPRVGEPNWALSELDSDYCHSRFINGLHEEGYISDEIDWQLIEQEDQE